MEDAESGSGTPAIDRYVPLVGAAEVDRVKEKARAFLLENPDVTEELKNKVLIAGGYAIDQVPVAADESGD